jgi:signal transduction histidine kinase
MMKTVHKSAVTQQETMRRAGAVRLAVAVDDRISAEPGPAMPRRALAVSRGMQGLRVELRQREAELHEIRARMARAERDLTWAHDEIEKSLRRQNEEYARENERLRQEISQHRQAGERVSEQNEFINHVLESLTHPFYVLDANDYTIKMANSAAVKGELKPGTTCYALTHHRDTPCEGIEHGCPLRIVKQTRKPVTMEHVHFDREGNPRHVEVHGYPIFDREGNVVQMLEYSLDITERKKMEEELRSNAEKIKLFAYAVSHDLKSPITGILGLIRLLHRRYAGSFDDKGRKICGQIVKSMEQVAALVEEINAYIKAKETTFHFEQVDPLDVLHTVRDEFAPLLSLHGVSWSEPASLPPMIMDRLSMIRVFRNLVDNAVKYGGEKMSEIAIRYRQDGAFHVLTVSDDGVGIREEDSERIFELFGRSCQARGIEGSGLGLAIVREIVGKHQGRVWVEPDSPRGATFAVALPIMAPAALPDSPCRSCPAPCPNAVNGRG